MSLRLWIRLVTIEAFRALARNKIRSGLSILGVTVAVATVIWVVAIGVATIDRALADLDKLGDNLVWIEAGSRTVRVVRTGNLGSTTLTVKDAAAIRNEVRLVSAVSENVDGPVQVIYGSLNWSTHFRGVSPEYADIKRWELAKGSFFTAEATEHFENVVVIGETVRQQLFGEDDPIGERIRIQNGLYEVVGLLAPKGQSITGQDQDDTVMVPWTTAQKHIVGKDITWLDDILCSAASADAIAMATEEISALIRERHHIVPGNPDDFNVRHPEELLQARVKSSRTLELLLLALASIAMAIGGIGIMNVMLASVAQRTGEIGVRMSIGARPSAIRIQFLGEAVMLSLIGGVLGVLLAMAGATTIEDALGWSLTMSMDSCLTAVLFSAAVGVLSGSYPANRAARLDPIEALRTE